MGNRAWTVGAVALLVAGAGVASNAPTHAAVSTCPVPSSSAPTSPQDVDGNGFSDLVVGVPLATVGDPEDPPAQKGDAGAVDVHFDVNKGFPTSTQAQRFDESDLGLAPQSHDGFGTSVAMTHVYNSASDPTTDSCTDLAIGAPGVDGGRGAVFIAFGSHDGVGSADSIRIDGRTAGDHFGAAVAADDAGDVWISAPNRAVSGKTQAGAVYQYRLVGSTATLLATYTEDSTGIPGLAEPNDHFGQVLAVDNQDRLRCLHCDVVAVGEPGEDVGRQADAGTVTVLRTSDAGARLSAAAVSQNSPGVSGAAEAGDNFGAALSLWSDGRLAVGVPGEDLGAAKDAGMVHLLTVASSGAITQLSAVTQDSPTILGSSETGDRFGSSVLLVGVLGSGIVNLAIGVPGENLGSIADTGSVVFTQLTDANAITGDGPNLQQGAANVVVPRQFVEVGQTLGGRADAGDQVGAGLFPIAYSSFPDDFAEGAMVAIAAPGEDGAGDVTIWPDDGLVPDQDYRVYVGVGHYPGDGERYGSGATAADNGVSSEGP